MNSNDDSDQSSPKANLKRPRGRPKGTFKVKPDAGQRALHADLLDTLASLSPIENLIEGKSAPSRRYAPAQFAAMREALLLKLIEDRPQDKDRIIARFTERPSDYTPASIESFRASEEAMDRVIEEANRPESLQRRLKQCEESLEIYSGGKDEYSKRALGRLQGEAEELRAKLEAAPLK